MDMTDIHGEDTFWWARHARLVGKYSSIACTFPWIYEYIHGYVEYSWCHIRLLLLLFATFPNTPSTARFFIIDQIIALAGDPFPSPITSLSLGLLLFLVLIACSMTPLGPYSHGWDIWTIGSLILINSTMTRDGTLRLRLDTRISTCGISSLLVSAVAMDWNPFGGTLLCSVVMKGHSSCGRRI